MTIKDLSRELCEICGIKPMYRLKDINALYNEDMYNEFCEMRLNKGLLIPTGTKAIFPDFTPEKQLELIKLIAQDNRGFQAVHFSEWTCESCHDSYNRNYFLKWAPGATFEEALARLLILLIKNKHLKKKEVKRILEDD